MNISLAAKIEKTKYRGYIKNVYHWSENTKNKHLLGLSFAELFASGNKILHLSFLSVKDLSDLDAGEVLGEEGVDVGRSVLYLTVSATGELSEDECDIDDVGYMYEVLTFNGNQFQAFEDELF